MNKYLEKLTKDEKNILYHAPVYAALRGALENGKIKHIQERESVRLAHIKTYSSHPVLREYYQEVEKTFEDFLFSLEKSLPTGLDEEKAFIDEKMAKIKPILEKLDSNFSNPLFNSLQSFSKHISGTKGILEEWLHYFIIPINL